MDTSYLETEHQELFYLGVDLHRPIAVHVPSALGALAYYVALRVPGETARRLAGLRVALKIGGLHPDDVELAYGEGIDGEQVLPARDGCAWVLVCKAKVSRGDGTVAFAGVPADVPPADVLLCTWPRFIESGQADDWIACQADPHWAPNGVPLGGIGCGKVEVSRDGRLRNFSGNNNQDMPFEEPDGLAGAWLSVGAGGEQRVLATRPAGGLEPCASLEFDAAFPQARLLAADALDGIDAEATLAGPVVPHELDLASLPGFIVRWKLTNRRAAPARVRVRLTWPNLVGTGGGIAEPEKQIGYADGFYQYWPAPHAPEARRIDRDGLAILRYANQPSAVSPAADGFHYVAVRGGRAEPTDDGTGGSVLAEVDLAPGAAATADMAVVWEMPHWIDTLGVDRGLYWQRTCRDGLGVLGVLFERFDHILEGGAALSRLLGQTDLPEWMRRRLANCCYPLVTNSVLYRDGRFSINEGPTEMAGCYGTIDQRLGAHPATQLLFPELNARELDQFAACQADNGGVVHDLGGGHLEREPGDQGWPDLTCSFIIQHARHAWSTGDEAFGAAAWERTRRALLRHAEWAEAGRGVAQVGEGLGTSYDGYHYVGTTPYMATLWLAALHVCRRWALRHGDDELIGRIDGWRDAAIARMEEDLWNGRFYRAFGRPGGPVNENAHAGMLAGAYYARMLTGCDVLPPERLAACCEALMQLNGSERFAAPPDEVAPDGEAATPYGWLPYVESFALAPLALLTGRRAVGLWRRVVGVLSQGGARPCDTRLMYRPTTGEPSWGSYYMTAPASWLVYEALLDFFYEPGAGKLRLAPSLEGSFAVVHPCFWAVGRRDVAGEAETIRLEVRRVHTTRDLTVRALEAPAGMTLRMAGKDLARREDRGAYAIHACEPVTLAPGASLRWDARPAG